MPSGVSKKRRSEIEDREWRIEDRAILHPRSSILDLASFRHCALHHRLIPLVEQILNRLERLAVLRHGLSNRSDGAHKTLAFGVVKRFEQFEILKIEHVVDNDGIVERLLGKVPESVCRMPGNPFGPLLFTLR